jgi:two-component system response regulator FlrC
LVVEDDAETREALVDLLNSSGFTALGATCVLDAFEVMVEKRPSLVLSDINLGDHHGGELLDMAMKILGDEAPPFVFVTGMSAWDIPGFPTSAPVLKKPINVDALLSIVTRHCLAGKATWSAN